MFYDNDADGMAQIRTEEPRIKVYSAIASRISAAGAALSGRIDQIKYFFRKGFFTRKPFSCKIRLDWRKKNGSGENFKITANDR